MTAVQVPEGLEGNEALRSLIEKAQRETAKQVEAHRAAVRKQLDALVKKREAEARTHGDVRAKAQQVVDDAEAALDAARHELQGAIVAQQRAGLRFDNERARLERELCALADPQIDRAIQDLRQLEEQTRRTQPRVIEPPANIDGVRAGPVLSNHNSIRERIARLRVAVAELEALRLEVGDNVAERIQQIRESVPPIGEPQRV